MKDEKQKWASEPWSLTVYDDGDAYVTHCATGRYINFKNEEILSRVLDCINSLSGIPDPEASVRREQIEACARIADVYAKKPYIVKEDEAAMQAVSGDIASRIRSQLSPTGKEEA